MPTPAKRSRSPSRSTPKPSRAGPAKSPAPNARVSVYWPEEKRWFAGTVETPSKKKDKKKVLVKYDDGDEEILDMSREKWKLLEEEEDDSDAAPLLTKKPCDARRGRSKSPKRKSSAAAAESLRERTGMGFWQEFSNGWTIILPFLAGVYRRYYEQGHPVPSSLQALLGSAPDLLIFSTLVHCPFSFIYHLRCAMGIYPTREAKLHNPWRRLDHTFIHFCCAVYSYALSGDLIYTAVLACMHLYCVCKVWGWHGNRSSVGLPLQRRLQPLIQLYLAPILWNGDSETYAKAYATGLLCFVLFKVVPLGGWGHALFHVGAAPYFLFLLEASEKVELGGWRGGAKWGGWGAGDGGMGALTKAVFVLGGGLMCYEWRRDGAQRRKYKEAVFTQ